MTNRHCDACGDPIFRHDGREFCPTCHATEDGYAVPADGEPAPAEETAGGAAANGSPASAGSDRTTGEVEADERAAATDAPQPAATPDPRPGGTGGGSDPTPTTPESASPAASDVRPGEHGGPSGGLDEARASLTRTLMRFARSAEETDDPRRARDHLEAAREAAEALSALER